MGIVNMEVITVQDCIDMYEKKEMITLISDGKIVGFFDQKE